jgi:hypothetical protein
MRHKLVAWFIAGAIAALFLQALQARATGGWAGLLSVGETSGLRTLIESELGEVPLLPFGGHDGQITYAIARQPFGGSVADQFIDAGYRYRRILYPLVAGLGGIVSGPPLLASLVMLAALGMGLATASVAWLAEHMGRSRWVTAAVLANPGVWLSVQLLTPDALGLGLGLAGICWWLAERHRPALVALALAVLTKDQFLLIPLALAGYELTRRQRRRAAVVLVAGATLPLAAWTAWLQTRMGGGLSPRGNLSPPFVGILDSVRYWPDRPAKDLVFGVLALAGILAAGLVSFRAEPKVVRWLAAPWAIIAIVSSGWVWDFGNNAVRALAPAIVFGVMGLIPQRRVASASRKNLPV